MPRPLNHNLPDKTDIAAQSGHSTAMPRPHDDAGDLLGEAMGAYKLQRGPDSVELHL